jgi:hypothetical protein
MISAILHFHIDSHDFILRMRKYKWYIPESRKSIRSTWNDADRIGYFEELCKENRHSLFRMATETQKCIQSNVSNTILI